MSKRYRISLICVMAAAMAVLCVMLYRYREQDKAGTEYENNRDSLYGGSAGLQSETPPDEEVPAAVVPSDLAKPDAELVIIEYYPDGMSRQYKTDLPDELVGLDRGGIDSRLDEYCDSLERIDVEKGLYRIELTAFSADAITIEKTYHKAPMDYYYLAFVDDCVTVYCEDKTTVLLMTDIHRDQLSDALVQEILGYKLIAGNAELFDFLESYTS